MTEQPSSGLETATLGSGCFWCTEAVFLRLKGVKNVESGYSGGTLPHPTYEQVCTGKTGHAEVVQITFDPLVISFDTLLDVFFKTHDPTTLNRQGNDIGSQYRSAVFFHGEQQRVIAEEKIRALNESGLYDSPIVTEVTPASDFYPAENYHQNYFALHGHEPYCSLVIHPKMEKFQKSFSDLLK